MTDDFEPIDSPQPPPNESWWEWELLRNEKMLEKFMDAPGDHPNWSRLHCAPHPNEGLDEEDSDFEVAGDEADLGEILESCDLDDEDADEEDDSVVAFEDCEEDPLDEDDAVSEGYSDIAQQARDFAVHMFEIKSFPENSDVFLLSAGKIGANLAGGHGLGYDEETICGNIVKCRWALSDCEFCREMLELAVVRTGRKELEERLDQCRALAVAIRDRIHRLRSRVWW